MEKEATMEDTLFRRDLPLYRVLLARFASNVSSLLSHLLVMHNESCGCHLSHEDSQRTYNQIWNQKKLQFMELHKLVPSMGFEEYLNRALRLLLLSDVPGTPALSEAEFWASLRTMPPERELGEDEAGSIAEEELDDIQNYIKQEMTSVATSGNPSKITRNTVPIDCTGIPSSYGLSWFCKHCSTQHSSKFDCAHYAYIHKTSHPLDQSELLIISQLGHVSAKAPLPKGSKFGPIVGETLSENRVDFDEDREGLWPLYRENSSRRLIVKGNSDWTKYISRASNAEAANILVISSLNQLYVVTCRDVEAGEELFIYDKEDPLTEFWTSRSRAWANQTKCSRCSSNGVFSNACDYRSHVSLWHDLRYDGNPLNRVYYCPDCGVKSVGAKEFLSHSREIHGSLPFLCLHCSKRFETYNSLLKHKVRMHDGGKPLKRTCLECGKEYADAKAWKFHVGQVHAKSKDLRCRECQLYFSSPYALNRHIKEVHDQSQEHSCPKCSRQFSQPSNLKQHMLIHTGEKPFPCRSCSSTFTTKQCLQVHYRKIHGLSDLNMPPIIKKPHST